MRQKHKKKKKRARQPPPHLFNKGIRAKAFKVGVLLLILTCDVFSATSGHQVKEDVLGFNTINSRNTG